MVRNPLSPQLDLLSATGRVRRFIESYTTSGTSDAIPAKIEQSPAGNLPPEVLSRILGSLVVTTYFGAVGYLFNKQHRNRKSATKAIQDIRTNLCHSMRVCKSWCQVGTELLYSNPLLLSIEEFKLLKRTLEDASDLSSLVKDISLLGFAWLRTVTSDPLGIKTRQAKRSNADVFSIFAVCPSLETMTVNTPMSCESDSLLSQSISGLFAENSNISTRLRKLTLDGGACHTAFSTFTLPVLEVLCLRFFLCTREFKFPSLPRVHTLLLVEIFSWVNNKALIPSSELPSLRNIEVYDWKYCSSSFDRYIISETPMRSVHLLGRAGDPIFFESLRDSQALSRVRELVVGVVESATHPFYDWKFPPTLKALTVFLSLKPYTRGGMYIPATSEMFDSLYSCLLRNNEGSMRGSLQTLDVLVPLDPTWEIPPFGMEDIASRVDEIKELCKTSKISVSVEVVGK